MGIGLCPSTCGRAPAGSGEVDSSPLAALSRSLSLLPWKQPHRDRSLCALHVPQLPPQTQQSLPVSHLHSVPPDCPPQNSPSPLLKHSEDLTWPRPLHQPSWASSTLGTLHSATQLDPREAQAHAVPSPWDAGGFLDVVGISGLGQYVYTTLSAWNCFPTSAWQSRLILQALAKTPPSRRRAHIVAVQAWHRLRPC